MNIKQVEELTGVSKQNIRFYEREGLISPERNPQNDYREYTDADVEIIKKIRIMRMFDISLEQIFKVVHHTLTLENVLKEQKDILEKRSEDLSEAIQMCEELSKLPEINSLKSDDIMEHMNNCRHSKGLFHDWVCDYRIIENSEHKKLFTFIPEGIITTPEEFTLELCGYGNANDLNLVITKEGMTPEFTIDGIEYVADVVYTYFRGIPVVNVRCEAKYPEDFEVDMPENKKKLLLFIHEHAFLVPILIVFLLYIVFTGIENLQWEACVLFISLMALALSMKTKDRVMIEYSKNKWRGKWGR